MNYLAILAATVLNMVIGGLWYGVFFGEPWMQATGLNPAAIDKSRAMKGYGLAAVTGLVRNFALAIFCTALGVHTAINGAILGAWFGIGIVTMSLIPHYYFPNRPWKLLLIDSGESTVAIIASATLLGAWR